jgi:hypothetical protein
MALKPISELIDALKGMALPGLPPARIGETTPKVPDDLPALRVVAAELVFSPLGMGGSRTILVDASDVRVEDLGRRIMGALNLEVWGEDEDAVNIMAMAVAEKIAETESALVDRGFLRLRQSKWRAAEEAPLRGTQSDKALRQILAYEIVFEDMGRQQQMT